MAKQNKISTGTEVKAAPKRRVWEGHMGTKKEMLRSISIEEVMLAHKLTGPEHRSFGDTMVVASQIKRGLFSSLEDRPKLSPVEEFLLDIHFGNYVLAQDEKGHYWTCPSWVDTGLLDPNRVYHRKLGPTPRTDSLATKSEMVVPITDAEIGDYKSMVSMIATVPEWMVKDHKDVQANGEYSSVTEKIEDYIQKQILVRAKDEQGYYWTFAAACASNIPDPWRILNRHEAPGPVLKTETASDTAPDCAFEKAVGNCPSGY